MSKTKKKTSMAGSKRERKMNRQARELRMRLRGLQGDGAAASPRTRVPTVDTSPPRVANTQVLANLVSEKKVTLTHDLAFQHLELPGIDQERGVTTGWVQTLYDEMRQSRFCWEDVRLKTCTYNGKTYRLNGQHTCWAFTNMPRGYKAEVIAQHYRASTIEEMRAIYAITDVGKTRTTNHRTAVLLAGSDATQGVPVSLINRLTTGMVFWLYDNDKDRRRLQPADRAALVEQMDYGKTFRFVGDAVKDSLSTAKFFKRAPVMGSLFATYHKVPTLAHEFWGPVGDGLGLDSRTDPRWKLRHYLQTHGLSASGDPGTKIVDAETMYRVCIQAWNKWRKNEKVQVLKSTDSRTKAK
jgi:hypothetical protein